MSDILIIGGGFAGVWAAACAARVRRDARSEVRIPPLSAGDDLVVRPRLYQEVVPRVRVPDRM